MRKLFILIGAAAALAAPAFAIEDAIATRKAIMQGNGALAGLAVGMMKEEIPYSPVAARAVLVALRADLLSFGDYIPAESDAGEGTRASPKIWEDRAAFDARLADFQNAATAAAEAGGRDGPPDLAAFQAAVGPVLNTCQSCHEDFQLPRD